MERTSHPQPIGRGREQANYRLIGTPARGPRFLLALGRTRDAAEAHFLAHWSAADWKRAKINFVHFERWDSLRAQWVFEKTAPIGSYRRRRQAWERMQDEARRLHRKPTRPRPDVRRPAPLPIGA